MIERMCKRNTYDITSDCGECPESCSYGVWNMMPEGVCGAECLNCGGTLYLTDKDEVYCDGCGFWKKSL